MESQAPHTKGKKVPYAQWGGVAVGTLIVACSIGDQHVSLSLFFTGLAMVIGSACYGRLGLSAFSSFDPRRDARSMRRAAKRSADAVLGNQEAPVIPPDEFLKSLGEREQRG